MVIGETNGSKEAFCKFYLGGYKSLWYQVKAHHDEPHVQRILDTSCPKEQSRLKSRLCHKGNFQHNIQTLKSKEGSFVVARKTSDNHNDYVVCRTCYKFFLARTVYRHRKQHQSKNEIMPRQILEAVRCWLDTQVDDH